MYLPPQASQAPGLLLPTSYSRRGILGGLCDVAPNPGAGLEGGYGRHPHRPRKGLGAVISEGWH